MSTFTSALPRIDVHAHFVVTPPPFAAQYADDRWPTLVTDEQGIRLVRDGRRVRSLPREAVSLADRIAVLDAAGLDHQVLSPVPPLICETGDPLRDAEWARLLNHGMAVAVEAYPTRFSALGIVPLGHPAAAVAVLEEASRCGLLGVEIDTRGGVRELDDPDLLEFFQAAAELGMLIFVHPVALGAVTTWTPRIDTVPTTFGLGLTTDTAIAACRLVFGGVLGRAPHLKVCLAHGGGSFAWVLTRIAHLWDASHDATAEELARPLYVDSVVFDPRNLRYLTDRLGADRVLFGTDHPMAGADSLTGDTLAALSVADRERLESRNLRAVLDLDSRLGSR